MSAIPELIKYFSPCGRRCAVARVQLEGEGVVHGEVHDQRFGVAKRIDGRGFRIGKQQHVGLVDGLESANRRAVEGQPVLEHGFVEGIDRNGEVLHGARQVAEADVDVLDVLVLGEFEDIIGRLIGHGLPPLLSSTAPSRRATTTHAAALSASGATISPTVARTSDLCEGCRR